MDHLETQVFTAFAEFSIAKVAGTSDCRRNALDSLFDAVDALCRNRRGEGITDLVFGKTTRCVSATPELVMGINHFAEFFGSEVRCRPTPFAGV